jgi:hypothetical protein
MKFNQLLDRASNVTAFWFNKSHCKSIDQEYYERMVAFQQEKKREKLKERVAAACTDTTDYELKLRIFCQNNRNNPVALKKVLIHRSRLIESGCDRQQAAKQTLEIFYS